MNSAAGSLRPGYRMIGEIPGVSVSLETGSLILRQLKRGKVRVRMNVQDEIKPNWTAHNVVGEIRGSKYPDELILVGNHFDGHDIAQGAADDKPIAKHTPVEEVVRRLEEKGEAEALKIQKKWHPDSIR